MYFAPLGIHGVESCDLWSIRKTIPCSFNAWLSIQYSNSTYFTPLRANTRMNKSTFLALSKDKFLINKIHKLKDFCFISLYLSFVAARTALHSFIQSRETTAREKDLLKSVKVRFFLYQRYPLFNYRALQIQQLLYHLFYLTRTQTCHVTFQAR